ncbi:FusB/FusC family EF-G-binding protein [Salimicrobium sp. PL1-032A]|uniref:FusB/FusC family EF-G-binding protein n=1 Tax=Salimicrobium sp. PL1-032A TaxID=3095364 RepID=UPI003261706A
MEPFIRSDQYHYIQQQVAHIVQANALINDKEMVQTIQAMARDKMSSVFEGLSGLQQRVLEGITYLEDRTDAEMFYARVLPLVQPFRMPSDEEVKGLFPHLLKVKPPVLSENVDARDMTYLSWFDPGLARKFLVTYRGGELVGMEGSFTYTGQKNICSICHEHEHVGLFVTDTTEFRRKGNYVCKDSIKCNLNMTTRDYLYNFMDDLKR